jgi:predicted CoA-binding protein
MGDMRIPSSGLPRTLGRFLGHERLAVAGVSRQRGAAANAVFRKLKGCGYTVFPLNPYADEVEGVKCYSDLASIPEEIGGVVIATHPSVSASIVRQCKDRNVEQVWFHRSFGQGSVSKEALSECARLEIECIVGGCPLMFCTPVDIGHKCMRWWLQRTGRVPK